MTSPLSRNSIQNPIADGQFIHTGDQLLADQPERARADSVHASSGFEVRCELLLGQAGFKLLNQFGGRDHFDAETAHQFDGARIHHGDVGDGASRRILHRDALLAVEQFRAAAHAVPASWNSGAFRQAEHVSTPDSMRCTIPTGSPLRGDHVIPAARDMHRCRKTQHPVGERIALVVIEEQPAVEIFPAKSFLNSSEIHAIRE